MFRVQSLVWRFLNLTDNGLTGSLHADRTVCLLREFEQPLELMFRVQLGFVDSLSHSHWLDRFLACWPYNVFA